MAQWLGLPVFFVGSLSFITAAHPSKALGSEVSRRDEQASILGPVNVLTPSVFNGGGTAFNDLQVDSALTSSGAGSYAVDEPLGEIIQIGRRLTLPVDQPLGENFELNVGGDLGKLSGDDMTLESKENVPKQQKSDEQYREVQEAAADDAAHAPLGPCNPSDQQSTKLRPRTPWCTINDQTRNPNADSNNDIPSVENSPPPPLVPSAIEDNDDSSCVFYSKGLLPLGVCSSPDPYRISRPRSRYRYGRMHTVSLQDADLGK